MSFFFIQLGFSIFKLFLNLGMLGFNVFNVVFKLLNFILAYLVLLSFQLFLLGQLILVGLTKCINFINPLFEFINLMVSERFLGGSFSLGFIDLSHVLLLEINHFFIQLLDFLILVFDSLFEGIYLDSGLFQIFLMLFKVLIQGISCSRMLLISFIHNFLPVSNFIFKMFYLLLCLSEVFRSCTMMVLGCFQFLLDLLQSRFQRSNLCFIILDFLQVFVVLFIKLLYFTLKIRLQL